MTALATGYAGAGSVNTKGLEVAPRQGGARLLAKSSRTANQHRWPLVDRAIKTGLAGRRGGNRCGTQPI